MRVTSQPALPTLCAQTPLAAKTESAPAISLADAKPLAPKFADPVVLKPQLNKGGTPLASSPQFLAVASASLPRAFRPAELGGNVFAIHTMRMQHFSGFEAHL